MAKFYRFIVQFLLGIIDGMSTVIVVFLLCMFFAIMGWLGDFDYCEQVILHMSQEEYDSVKNLLTERDGEVPSERDIAHWWEDHNGNN